MANGFNFEDLNLSDILLPTAGYLAAAMQKVPTRYGWVRAGLGPGLAGAVEGHELAQRARERRERRLREKSLSELFGPSGYFAEKLPTGRQISREVPTGEFGPTKETEPGDYPIGSVPQTRTEVTPEMAPRLSEDKRRILASLPASVQASTLGHILTQEEKPISVGRGGLAIKDSSRPTGYRIIAPPPVAEASPFAKPSTPTTKDYSPESIVQWRKTRTPDNPEGDLSILVPKPKDLAPTPTTREYTPQSIREWRATGDETLLVPREKPEKISPRDAAFQRLSREEQRQVLLREGNPDKPLTQKQKQDVLYRIMGEARRQVEGQFRGTLGQIDIGALGKTPGERGAKFLEMIRNTAREIAEERGIDLDELRSPTPGAKAKKILGAARAEKIFQDAQGDPHIAAQMAKEQGFTHDEEGNPF